MTEYAYKLVSLKARGQIDWPALKRATERGWEPVPLGEEPSPSPNPLGMTPEQLENFRLCRMPKEKHGKIIETLARLNAALVAPWTQDIIHIFKFHGWPEVGFLLRPRLVNEDGEEVSPEVRMTAEMLAGAKLAYEWLHDRGLD